MRNVLYISVISKNLSLCLDKRLVCRLGTFKVMNMYELGLTNNYAVHDVCH